ncbi:MAG: LirA/MavJ family T4SS effector [Thermoanaerobaculia bacterium]
MAPRPPARVPAPQVPSPVQPKPAAVRLSPPTLQARAPVAPPPPAVPAAARPSGHRSAPSFPTTIAQAKFPLKKHFSETLSNRTLGELEAIQDLLKDKGRVQEALANLESQMEKYIEDGETVNSALNLALQEEEHQWMNPGRIKVAKDSAITRQDPKKTRGKSHGFTRFPGTGGNGELPPSDFVSRALVPLRALKDVGAVPAHGEYAHRLQWYIISFHFREKLSADELRHLYLMMGSSSRVIQHPTQEARISLWDAVLDVRGAWAMDKGETGELYEGPEGVGFAVPGFLTGVLTIDDLGPKAKVLKSYDDNFLHGERWSKSFPNLATAVTRRKLKRLA